MTKTILAISLAAAMLIPNGGNLAIQADDTVTPVVSDELVISVNRVKPDYDIIINHSEAQALAMMAWGEARGCSDMEVAATMWCVLNRVDETGDSIIEVITAPNQFLGYGEWCPVEDRFYHLAVDVLTRWQIEKQGASPEEVGRVLPQEYMWFSGDGKHNYFRDSFINGNRWDWNCDNPYETEGS